MTILLKSSSPIKTAKSAQEIENFFMTELLNNQYKPLI